eukprot:4520614-Prorocentrum_lima.AAC.1
MQTRCEAPSWGGARAGHGPWRCLKRQEWPADRAHAEPLCGSVGRCHNRTWTKAAVVVLSGHGHCVV